MVSNCPTLQSKNWSLRAVISCWQRQSSTQLCDLYPVCTLKLICGILIQLALQSVRSLVELLSTTEEHKFSAKTSHFHVCVEDHQKRGEYAGWQHAAGRKAGEARSAYSSSKKRNTHMALKAPLALSCTLRSSAAIFYRKNITIFWIPSLRFVLLVKSWPLLQIIFQILEQSMMFSFSHCLVIHGDDLTWSAWWNKVQCKKSPMVVTHIYFVYYKNKTK